MALGDKLPVVMGREKAAPEGVATLDADGILTEAQRPSLGQIKGGSNPNLLLNWDFRNPVNRNGQAEYAANAYNIDCWRSNNSTVAVSIVSGGIKLTLRSATTGWAFYQSINNVQDFIGKALTVSTKSPASNGNFLRLIISARNSADAEITAVSATISAGVISVSMPSVPEETLSLRVGSYSYGGSAVEDYVDIEAIKLELGDHQTLARKNEDGEWAIIDPPDYDLQYLLCSQYSPSTGEWVGSQHSNPNLLDNWYFVGGGSQQGGGQFPINQRGQTEYTGIGYSIDRWRTGTVHAKTLLLNNKIRIGFNTSAEGMPQAFYQYVESVDNLIQKQLTLSFLIESIQGGAWTLALRYSNDKGYISAGTRSLSKSGLYTVTGIVPEGTTKLQALLISSGISPDRSIDIIAAKLELGPVQTLAHKEGGTWVLNDPPPNYQQELAKCQRSQVFGHLSSVPYVKSGSDYLVLLPLPVPLRAIPTIIGKPNVYNVSNSVKATGAAVAVKRLDENGVILTVSNVNEPCVVYFGPEADIGLDANL